MSEWKEYKLGEIVNLIKDTYSPIGSGIMNYIGLEHIEQNTLRLNNVGKSIDVTSNKFIFKANDILFGKLRVYFRKVVKPNFDGICSTDIWVFRAKEGIDQDFLFYFVANWDFINLADSGEGGTRMPRADWNFLKSTVWNIPELSEQTAIASILSSLDDKIDLLHRQNATLEKMAETLFRQWFVERRPEPVEGKAKEEWEEISLYDAIELVGGGTPKTIVNEYWNGNIKWLSGGDIASNHKNFVVSSEKTITELGLRNSSAKLLPKFSTVISARGTVGKYCLLSEPMAYSQSNYGILPRYKDCFFFTYLLVAHSVDELQSAAYGSVFDTITTDTFKGISISLPKEENIIQFEESMKPFFFKILINQTQIRTLTALRDTLLPKLMSGEIRVL
jgi:type I restriction enzyme S subunit